MHHRRTVGLDIPCQVALLQSLTPLLQAGRVMNQPDRPAWVGGQARGLGVERRRTKTRKRRGQWETVLRPTTRRSAIMNVMPNHTASITRSQ
jgi:hypothetical protein